MQKPVSQVESVLNLAGLDKPQQLHTARALCWAHKNTGSGMNRTAVTGMVFICMPLNTLFVANRGISVANLKHSQKESQT